MAKRDITGAVDFSYLESFAGTDDSLIDEVLEIFREQAGLWSPMLEADSVGWRDAVHTVKGAARGVGAFALGDACERAEQGGSLDAVRDAIDAALLDIAAYRHERMLKALKTPRETFG